jgi:hypothetical protein
VEENSNFNGKGNTFLGSAEAMKIKEYISYAYSSFLLLTENI